MRYLKYPGSSKVVNKFPELFYTWKSLEGWWWGLNINISIITVCKVVIMNDYNHPPHSTWARGDRERWHSKCRIILYTRSINIIWHVLLLPLIYINITFYIIRIHNCSFNCFGNCTNIFDHLSSKINFKLSIQWNFCTKPFWKVLKLHNLFEFSHWHHTKYKEFYPL